MLVISYVYFKITTSVCAEKLNTTACNQMGFMDSSLLCSSCDELKQFKLNKLEASCKQCCVNDVNEEETQTVRNIFK